MGNHLENFNLEGKVAVVTGASEGIGRDLAIGLADAVYDGVQVGSPVSEYIAIGVVTVLLVPPLPSVIVSSPAPFPGTVRVLDIPVGAIGAEVEGIVRGYRYPGI